MKPIKIICGVFVCLASMQVMAKGNVNSQSIETKLKGACLQADGSASSKNPNAISNACGGNALDVHLKKTVDASSGGAGLGAYSMPASDDYENIPADPNNPITAEKVALGQLLYHETALSTEGNNPDTTGTYSCASCHHVAAGFKSGIPQGIAEGGSGFGLTGEGRVLADGFGPNMALEFRPDIQPFTSPSVLNTAFQDVMLWNGQFGNVAGGINSNVPDSILSTEGTPKANNGFGLSGLETQAIAGTGVHRMNTSEDSIVQTNATYVAMFDAAFPTSTNTLLDTSKAIAAYERTLLANEAPFQRWLNGDEDAMTNAQKRGASLFFGKASCTDCHRGPALSSEVGASEDEMFFAIGFADFDSNDPKIHTAPNSVEARGRGGFTGDSTDDFKFKIPQLYNLVDTDVFGHGASFKTVREVVEYKNAAVAQKSLPDGALDSRFVPLGLSVAEIDDLTVFLEEALYDPNLTRYVPESLPSGNCFPVNDPQAQIDMDC